MPGGDSDCPAQITDAQDRGARVPAVSVIVPVYNVAAQVGAAIESLRAQTFDDFEAIVVDDGSTDFSADLARAAAGDDPRFVFLHQPNAGLSAARNAGLAVARAPLIAFLDSDDRFAPAFLERLTGILEDSGAPWVACAVAITGPDEATGAAHVASAIHGQAHPATAEAWAEMPLLDWAEIVRHWPSAWNKLYRREFVGGLRFPEGLAFEDHAWFNALADRARSLAYVPEPLYLHARGRPGQITSDDSDRAFDQFAILDRVEAVMRASVKPGAEAGLARLATRTLHERATTVRAPERRRRFVERARAYFDARRLDWTPGWDRAISRSFAGVLRGTLPLTVVIATDGNGPGLERSVRSLARQYQADLEALIVPTRPGPDVRDRLDAAARLLPGARVLSGGHGSVADARNRGIAEATGTFTVVLDAGDWYAPGALWLWVEALLREDADLGVGRIFKGGGVHPGTHDGRDPFGMAWPRDTDPRARDWLAHLEGSARAIPPERALRLHAHPSAKIFRTALLQGERIRFAGEPCGSWGFVLEAGLKAPRAVALPPRGLLVSDSPIDRRLWRGRSSPEAIDRALLRLAPMLDAHMPRERWYPVLLARALWEKARFADFPDGAAKTAFMRDARALVARTCATVNPDDGLDGFVDQGIRDLFPATWPARA